MIGPSRLAAIQERVARGESFRGIGRALGISDKTVRRTLRGADMAPVVTQPGVTTDYIEPGPLRVIPTPTRDQALFEGGVSHPGKAWIRCTCGGPAWRDKSGVDSWTCGATVGPRGPHPPRQVADAAGVPQIRYGSFVIRPFPGLPPDDAA